MKKKGYYILNKKTGYNYDPFLDMFFSEDYDPIVQEDIRFLKMLINDDPEFFKYCVIVDYNTGEYIE